MKKLFVSDITMRSEAAKSLSFREKMLLVKLIDTLGADSIELPESDGSREGAVILSSIAGAIKNSRAIVTAHATPESVMSACETAKAAKEPCVMVELPVSTVSMEYEYHLKSSKMLALAEKLLSTAKENCDCVELCLRDASRAEPEFLAELAAVAEKLGVSGVTVCDDAGVLLPEEIYELVKGLTEKVNINVYVSVSDSIGMANAAAAAAVRAGAAGVKAGASAGNLSIVEFSELVRVKGDYIGAECSLDYTRLHRFAEEISGVLNGSVTEAPSVAIAQENEIFLTNESTLEDVGKAVLALGYELSDEDNGKAFEELKRVSRRKESIGAKELEAIIASACMQVPSTYHLESYISTSGNIIPATANITLMKDGEKLSGVASGDGPIDASFRAIENIIGHHYELDDFKITSVTQGREAVGSAIVRLRADGKLYSGNGVSTDIIGASIRAYINALNKIVYSM